MKIFVCLALFLPLLSQAEFNGRYTGPGSSLTHKSGTKRKCSEIFVSFARSEGKLSIDGGGYKCENLQASLDPFTLDLRDGKIFFEGEDLGTFDGRTLDLFYANREEDFTYHWRLEEDSGSMTYLEEWTDRGSPALTVSGVLNRLPPEKK